MPVSIIIWLKLNPIDKLTFQQYYLEHKLFFNNSFVSNVVKFEHKQLHIKPLKLLKKKKKKEDKTIKKLQKYNSYNRIFLHSIRSASKRLLQEK